MMSICDSTGKVKFSSVKLGHHSSHILLLDLFLCNLDFDCMVPTTSQFGHLRVDCQV